MDESLLYTGDSMLDETIQDPYWKIPTSELNSFLTLASLFSWRTGRDLTCKSVCLSLSQDRSYLECRATDFDTHLMFKIPILSTNPITKTLIIQTSSLLKLVKLSSKELVIRYKDDVSGVMILGQWVDVDTVDIDPSLYKKEDPVMIKGSFSIPKVLNTLIPLVSSATIPRDRNLSFYSSVLQCTYLWSTLHVSLATPIPFIISSREASLIKNLPSSEVSLGITESDLPRLSFSTDKISLLLIYRKPESDLNSFNIPDFKVCLDYGILQSLIQLSETLPSSMGLLQFKYNKDSGFIITYCSKLSDTEYPISCDIIGDPIELPSSTIQTKTLRQLIKPLCNGLLALSWDLTTLYVQSSESRISIRFEN